uniref:Ig-like domain-containing protein n=1 Tax=Periophthalmus magnuspinnatus TaxID=409849 RepID=A0A3B3ZZW4_9GOBI
MKVNHTSRVLFNRSNTVTQTQGDASVPQGHTATIQCTFKTLDSNPGLFWYKQENGGFPKYMMRRFKSGFADNSQEFKKPKFDAELMGTSFSLKIQDVDVTDSAVYYCALQPTVTGNTKTLNKNLWRTSGTGLLLVHRVN